jgi:hypothetical protein
MACSDACHLDRVVCAGDSSKNTRRRQRLIFTSFYN